MADMRALLIFIVALAPLRAAGRQQVTTFHAGVTDVQVDADVLDGVRRIDSMNQADFKVFDEGSPQVIEYFGHDAVPVDLVVLLDVSGSVQPALLDIAAIARSALGKLQEADQVAVMVFSRDAWIEQAFTSDPDEIAQAIEKASHELPVGSGTRIDAAVLAAANYLGREERTQVRRRAILIVTDNDGISYQVHQSDAVKALYGADTVLDAIVVGRHPHPPEPRPGSVINPDFAFDDVFALADATGGEAVAASKPQRRFTGLLARIRSRYTLVYRAPNAVPGTFRHIRVELSPEARRRYPHAVIRARGGYYVNRESAKENP